MFKRFRSDMAENPLHFYHILTGTEPEEQAEGLAGVLGRLLGRR